MNRKNKLLVGTVTALFALSIVLVGVALAAGEGIAPWAITGGGGAVQSGNAIMRSAIGQPLAGAVAMGDVQLCVGIACPVGDSGSTPVSTPTPMPTPGPANEDVVISEVYYAGDSNTDWIELKNTGNSTIDLREWQLCARFDYEGVAAMKVLTGDLMLAPGKYIVFQAWTDLEMTSDLGLYSNGKDFGDEANMVDFVQWGTPDNIGRANVAVKKQIWTERSSGVYDFVPTVSSEKESLALTSSGDGNDSTDFNNGEPSFGSDKPGGSFGVTNDIYLPAVMKE